MPRRSGSYGVTMTIRPGETACLACLLEAAMKNPRRFGAEATCDTAGVLNAAVGVIASHRSCRSDQNSLPENQKRCTDGWFPCDVWSGKFQSIRVARNPDCRACGRRDFAYLEGEAQPHITMCGRDSVQIHERSRKLDLDELGRRLSRIRAPEVRHNDFCCAFAFPRTK